MRFMLGMPTCTSCGAPIEQPKPHSTLCFACRKAINGETSSGGMARLASQQPSSPRPASPLGEKATADQTGLLDGKLKALARQLVEPGSVYSRGEDDPRWRAAVELGESSTPEASLSFLMR